MVREDAAEDRPELWGWPLGAILKTGRCVTIAFTSPLPTQYLTSGGGVGGELKSREEDFLVDEIPLYEPCGRGEHLYLFIEKRGVSHSEMLSTLRRHFRVPEKAIGFAGMKDKVGITRQLVSIHLAGETNADVEIPHERITVLWSDWHTNKLRRGHLKGNRFSIRLRQVDPLRTPRALMILRELEARGVPNYFGEQRFGYRCNNHLLGAMLLRHDWQGVLDELLGSGQSPFPEFQEQRRLLYDERCFAEALDLWASPDRTERTALRALAQGMSAQQACAQFDMTARSFFINAFQSAIFNELLDQRIEHGMFNTLQPGDLAWKHDSRAVFQVTAQDDTQELQHRLDLFEISPTGPLWGPETPRGRDELDRREVDALLQTGITLDDLASSRFPSRGQRRPFRVPISHIEIEGGVDEAGPFIRTAFDLPRGSYATVALREVMQNDTL